MNRIVFICSVVVATAIVSATAPDSQYKSRNAFISHQGNLIKEPDTIILEVDADGDITKRKILTSDSTYLIQKLDGYFGYISDVFPYTNNKLNGLVQTFFPDGIVMHQIPFENGIINGTEKFYYDDGTIDWTRQYDSTGMLHGEKFTYFRNGTLESSSPFIHGKQSGVGCTYAIDGSLVLKYYYNSDTLKIVEHYSNDSIISVDYLNEYLPYQVK